MKRILFIILTSLFIHEGFGQQDPQYTQYMYNMNVVNPAYAGSRETLSIGVLGRTQWTGFEGSPKTLTLSLHSPLSKKVGLGISLIADENGPVKEQNIYADFSYTLQTSEKGKFAFGLKGGVTISNADLLLRTVNPDPSFNNNINSTNPNFGAGAFYYTDKFYLGLSVPNFIETNTAEFENNTISKVSESSHYFITSGYVFDLNKRVKFKPSTLIKAVNGVPLSIDLSANFLFDDRFEIGASYRLDDSISALATFEVSRGFRIGYAYDHTLSNLGDFNNGSHEAFLLWDILSTEKNIRSPRFF